MYKGISKNQNYTWLICATQNMKNIVTKLTNKPKKPKVTNNNNISNSYFYVFISKIIKLFSKATNPILIG